MNDNPLRRLQLLGQSVWVNAADGNMIADGTLRRHIEEDGVSGLTAVVAMERTAGGKLVYRRDGAAGLTLAEAIEAADLMAPVYKTSGGSNGFVCLEISPGKACSSGDIVADARALWSAASRPNVLIKVPATPAGLPAICYLIADGIGVNAGMICSIDRYWDVVDAYLSGLEARQSAKRPIGQVISVATFALGSMDAFIDPRLARLARDAGPGWERALQLSGRWAVACAKLAYRDFRHAIQRRRFQALACSDAQPQRLLWDSAGVQAPAADFRYIEPLIGPDTICTMSPETLDAYRQHGCPAPTLSKGFAEADQLLFDLNELGIDVSRMDTAAERQSEVLPFIAVHNGRDAMPGAMQ